MDSPTQPTDAFELPDHLELPAELIGSVPRRLPDSVHDSRLAQERRNIFGGLLTVGVICGVLAFMPFIDTLALYVLPLGYLLWISLGLIGFSVVSHFSGGELQKACHYLEEGEASFARVDSLAKMPTLVVNGQTTTYAFVAGLQTQHPETGEPVTCEVKSRNFSTDKKDTIDTRFRVGDYVPIVWLPNKFADTLQIYDFLEITPEASLVRQDDKPTPLWQVIGLLLLLFGLFFALFWNIYAFGRFTPVEFDWGRQGLPPFIGGGALGLIGMVIVWLNSKRQLQELEQRNLDAQQAGGAVELPAHSSKIGGLFMGLLLLSGAILMSGLTVVCWCWTANALLDRSAPKREPVFIVEMVQVTHAFLFREYKMEYHFINEQEEHSMLTTPQHLFEFDAPLGTAVVRQGWLGWPWVETIEPLLVRDVEAEE